MYFVTMTHYFPSAGQSIGAWILTRGELIDCCGLFAGQPFENPRSEHMKHLQESKHVRVLVVSCKILRGELVIVGNNVLVDIMTIHTTCDTALASICNRIKKPIFGIMPPTLRLWLVFLT